MLQPRLSKHQPMIRGPKRHSTIGYRLLCDHGIQAKARAEAARRHDTPRGHLSTSNLGESRGHFRSGRHRHRISKALGPHILPILFDIIQTHLPAESAVTTLDDSPASGHRRKTRPQRVLLLIVYQHIKCAVFVIKRIGGQNTDLSY